MREGVIIFSKRLSWLAAGVSTAVLATGLSAAPAAAQEQQDDSAPVSDDGDLQQSAAGQTIVVTGSRIAASGFTAPTPVTVIGAQDLQEQGASNVAEVLNELPSFRAQSTPATTAIFIGEAGANTVDLRGLGGSRTLVLVDGRRFVAGTTRGSGNRPAGAVDLNMIPSSLISRVEVVTGGASAAYGSDAVSGVVNLILDNDLQGFRGAVQTGISERGDAEEVSASAAFGTGFAGGAGHVILGGEYVNNKGVGDCYTRSWCGDYEFGPIANPTPQLNGLARQLILPNVRPSATSFNGLIATGPLAGTEIARDGTIFQHDYGTYYGAPIFQSGGSADPEHAFYQHFPIYSPVERYALYGRGEFEVSEVLTVFGEANYAKVNASTISAQGRLFLNTAPVIGRDNPYLSDELTAAMDAAGVTSIALGRVTNDFGPQTGLANRNTLRFVGGFDADLGSSWTANAYYQFGRTKYRQVGYNTLIPSNFNRAVDAVDEGEFLTGTPNGNIVCRSTLTDPTNPLVQGCQPLNILGQYNYDPANVGYSFGTAIQENKLTQHVAALTLQGDLFELPAGAVAVATGIEYRVEDVVGTADPVSEALRFYTNNAVGISGPAVKVKEAFFEAGVPVLQDAPFAQSLDLNGAVRLTDYSTSGSVWSWKVGAVWEPVDILRLRVTRSRDIRAPNFFELYNPRTSSFSFLADPTRGGISSLTRVLGGGNSGLDPEKADTFTAGAVLDLGQFRFSADYFDINVDGAISTVGPQVIVDRCAGGSQEFCQFITRDSAGVLSTVLSTSQNLNTIKTKGVDIEAYYRHPVGSGDLTVRLVGTYVFDLITVDSNGATDYAGQNGFPVSGQSGLPDFEATANVGWSNEVFGGAFRFRYLSSGVYDITKIAPGDDGYDPTLRNSINVNHVPDFLYVDMNAHVNIELDADTKMQVFGVVNNLLDKNPPNKLPSNTGVTNPALYDVIGRSYRFGVRLNF